MLNLWFESLVVALVVFAGFLLGRWCSRLAKPWWQLGYCIPLGLIAEEGELAILARTSSLTGTEPDVLAKVLQKRYSADGLIAEYRAFKDIEDLRKAGLTVAVVEFNSMLDHCVTVLGVEDNQVV